jgi:hypothetical protein
MALTLDGTAGLILPSWTTEGRPTSPQNGQMGLNTTLGYIEWYRADQATWYPVYSSLAPILNTITVDYLALAGGGGGGANEGANGGDAAGGGGGGGLLVENLVVTLGTQYTVTVGAGGTGSAAPSIRGSTGVNSIIATASTTLVTTYGGGGGGSDQAVAGDGGSGGGAASQFSLFRAGGFGRFPGSTFPYLENQVQQGNNGGFTSGTGGTSGRGGAGGGGAGGAGVNNPGTLNGTAGGVGRMCSITGAQVFYAGGGGGGGYSDPGGTGGAGGQGGGGAGGNRGNSGTAGTMNTGGGGGGAGSINAATQYSGGNGGSGVVVIRYADTHPIATTTGSPVYTVVDGFRIYQFNSSGTITF